jgi:hypothetical protein
MMASQMPLTGLTNKAGRNGIRNQLSDQQYKAIRLAAEIGCDIRKNYPEIADEYRSGQTAPLLVAAHEFDNKYKINRRTAINAVRNALCGFFGYCHEPYDGLIGDRFEQQRLALAHNKQTGIEAFKRREGIHALTREQRVEAGRKGGLIRGPLSYQLRIGCHAMPPEALREHLGRFSPLGRKAGGVASVRAKGLTPFAPATPERMAEIDFALRLAEDPRCLGPRRTNFKKIAEKVNDVFHSGNLRYTRTSLKIALQKLRRDNRRKAIAHVDSEILFAEQLARDPAYQIPARIKAEEIARLVNKEYHSGKPVRNSFSIRNAIQCRRNRGVS